jgi:hypothetical protein
MIWTVCGEEEIILNMEVANFAKALNGESTIFLKTESSKNIKVSFETIANLLSGHYPNSDMDLKQQKDDVSRRSQPTYQNAENI